MQESKESTKKDKLTNWKEEPSLSDLKKDFEESKVSHSAMTSRVNTWLDNLNITGSAVVNTPNGSSKVVPKVIRKQAEWRYAALTEPFLSTKDVFNVSPVAWDDTKAARQNEIILNNQFNTKINKVAFIDEYIRTAVNEGTVIVRVGWEFEEAEVEVEVPTYTYKPDTSPTAMQSMQQMLSLIQSNPQSIQELSEVDKKSLEMSSKNGYPTIAVESGSTIKKEMKVLRNNPTVEVCDFKNIYIDPTCGNDFSKASFVIYSFESSLSELKRDDRYKNLDKINIESTSVLGEPDHAAINAETQTFTFKDSARKKLVVFEYWGFRDIDGSGRVRPIVASWVDDVLIRLEENPFPDGKLPFVVVPYLPTKKSIYGEPDGSLLEDNQKIIGAVTRGMIDIMGKSANGQTGIRKDMLDSSNRRKFEKGLDYEFNPTVDPRAGVFMHTYPEIPNSAQFMLQAQNLEAESLTGVKAFNQGISSQSLGDVASGIRSALDAASKRELGILRRLAYGIVEIGRKIIAMNGEFLSETEIVRVTNSEFVEIRRDDLYGNFDLELTISTAEEDDNKAQELAFMLQTMGNSLDPSMSQMILADIARLRKMPELAKKIEEYQPQQDPMIQQRAQLELMLLQAQIESEKAKAQHYLAGSSLAQSKQKNLDSDTDLKNLDFLEQESGAKQARDLQKIEHNSKANLNLKALDSMWKLRAQGLKNLGKGSR